MSNYEVVDELTIDKGQEDLSSTTITTYFI